MLGSLSPLLAFVAGALSVLSPCVLPLLPILFGSAASRHRWGPLALGAGIAFSFTTVALFMATIGLSLGLDSEMLRHGGGLALLVFGTILLVPALQARFAAAGAPVMAWGGQAFRGLEQGGLMTQGLLGGLLGLVWSPCVGPTLGAASLLAAQGQDLPQVAAVMLAFGLGAGSPLVAIGMISGEGAKRWRPKLRAVARGGKPLLGVALLLTGALISSGLDRHLEVWLVDLSPAWLTRITTQI